MNIESKKFKIKSQHGIISVTNKTTSNSVVVSSNDIPSAYEMAMMTENEFDEAMEELMN